MAFIMKRGDLRPNLPFQIFQADGETPLDLTTVESISLAMRHKAGDPPLDFKKECVIADAENGLGYYEWVDGDTDTAGEYEYEFEIIWSDGDPQTVPVDSYFELVIIQDVA